MPDDEDMFSPSWKPLRPTEEPEEDAIDDYWIGNLVLLSLTALAVILGVQLLGYLMMALSWLIDQQIHPLIHLLLLIVTVSSIATYASRLYEGRRQHREERRKKTGEQ